MFDLNQSIAAWRRQMIAGGIKSPEVLDELESHLRDDVEEQTRSGVSAERAFEIAVARVDRSAVLKTEFTKLDASRARRRWLRILSVGSGALMLASSALTYRVFAPRMGEEVLGMTLISLLALYMAGLPYSWRILSGGGSARTRKALKLAAWFGAPCLWLAMVFSNRVIHLPGGVTISLLWWALPVALILTGMMDDPDNEVPAFEGVGTAAFTPDARQSFELAREEAN